MLGQLGAQRGLDHSAGELRQKAARAGDLLRFEPLHHVLERLGRQQPRETVDDFSGGPDAASGAGRLDFVLCVLIEGVLSGPPAGSEPPLALRASRRSRPGSTSLVGHPDLTQNIGQNRGGHRVADHHPADRHQVAGLGVEHPQDQDEPERGCAGHSERDQ